MKSDRPASHEWEGVADQSPVAIRLSPVTMQGGAPASASLS